MSMSEWLKKHPAQSDEFRKACDEWVDQASHERSLRGAARRVHEKLARAIEALGMPGVAYRLFGRNSYKGKQAYLCGRTKGVLKQFFLNLIRRRKPQPPWSQIDDLSFDEGPSWLDDVDRVKKAHADHQKHLEMLRETAAPDPEWDR